MTDKWVLQQIGRQKWRLTNTAGYTAENVRLRLAGAVVGGMFGDRNWSASFDEVAHLQAIEFLAAPASSADEAPRLRVTWTRPPSDHEQLSTLYFR